MTSDLVTRSREELNDLHALNEASQFAFEEELTINDNYRDFVEWFQTFKSLGILHKKSVRDALESIKLMGVGATFSKLEPQIRLAAVNKLVSPFFQSQYKVPVSVAKSRELDTFFLRESGVMMVWGLTGTGKSATAHRIIEKYTLGDNIWMFNCPPNKRDLFPSHYNHFDDIELIKSLPPGSIILWDDATKDVWYMDWQKKGNSDLGKFITLIRHHKLHLVMVIQGFELFHEKILRSTPICIYMKFVAGAEEKILEERNSYRDLLHKGYRIVYDFYQVSGVPLKELGCFYDAEYKSTTLIFNNKCPWYGDAQSTFMATNKKKESE